MRLSGLIMVAWVCLLPPTTPAFGADPGAGPVSEPAEAVFRKLGNSPVDAFRKLLSMAPAERDRFLTNYPPRTRERIAAKLEQYALLPPEYRELRLRVTELQWYLVPLLNAPREQRPERLKAIPQPYNDLVKARLEEWDLWPPELKSEILDYETTLNEFVGRDAQGKAAVVRPLEPVADESNHQPTDMERKLALWQQMPQEKREQMYASFERFFELSEAERQKTLDSLPDPEREDTAKVVGYLEKQPRPEQRAYLAAFRQFAEMTSDQRRQFASNVNRWRKMSAPERQAWRDLVQQLAELPPTPPGLRVELFPSNSSIPVPAQP